MNEISLLTPVKKTIDTISGYLAQPELEVTAFGVEHGIGVDTTKVSVKIDDKTSFTILLYKEKEIK
jgi:hypothetical protein